VTNGGVRSSTRTLNEQLGPPGAVQVTAEVPTGKNESDGGVQVTVPQLPVVLRFGYFTMAPHCESFVATVISPDPQLITHGELPATRVVALAELLVGLASATALEAEAVFVMTVPFGVATPTCTPITKLEIVPESRSGWVQVIIPEPPAGGVVQVQPGAADRDLNVVLAGMLSLKVALIASLGPAFVTLTR